jgi:ankyrin repeat protein
MRYEEFIKLLKDNKIDEVKKYLNSLKEKDINNFDFISGHTLLHDVIYYNGDKSLCELLLDKMDISFSTRKIGAVFGGDFVVSDMDKTALHLAAERGYFDICELLLNKIPFPQSLTLFLEDWHNCTPFELAKFHKHDKICELITNYINTHNKTSTLN